MTILDQIVNSKRGELERAKLARPIDVVRRAAEQADPPRDFASAVVPLQAGGVNLIAEIKKASPSAGVIVPDFDPVRIARTYERAGASAISVLTDEPYFDGRLEYLAQVKQAVGLPVLRKDFIIDEYQVVESRAAGADCILLIAEVLSVDKIKHLHGSARDLGLAVLIEVHTESNLDKILAELGPPRPGLYLLGINNRDLSVQRTDLSTCERLGAKLPPGAGFVAESGIATRKDVERIRAAGSHAMLVGESLLRADDIATRIRELLSRGINRG